MAKRRKASQSAVIAHGIVRGFIWAIGVPVFLLLLWIFIRMQLNG